MGIFNNIDNFTNVNISEYIRSITQKIQVSGVFKFDSNNNYDIQNKRNH